MFTSASSIFSIWNWLFISLIVAVKLFAARIFCLYANIRVGRRMITEGDANYQICNLPPVTVTKGFKGETGPYKNCLLWF